MLTHLRRTPLSSSILLGSIGLLAACASRPVNPPITHVDPAAGYRFELRQAHETRRDKENLVILAFSGGGTRAASFSYGVLEFLRKTEVTDSAGNKHRLLDSVDLITGVSGGSFTALAYGLYGDKLFDDYESRFLKRNVQGALTKMTFNPLNWPKIWSTGVGRSELASNYYDEILFNGATFGDLSRGQGPIIMASATDLSTGVRFVFNQTIFDVICSDLSSVKLSRAAAASSAVPVVLSPVTLNNYGGKCGMTPPSWAKPFIGVEEPPRPAARAVRTLENMQTMGDGANRPYLHLIDGGVSDNLGLRGVLDALQIMQALHLSGKPTPLDNARRIVIFIVNSLSLPPTNWDKSEEPPGSISTMLKAAGTPIDQTSYENVEQLKDMAEEWRRMRLLSKSAGLSSNRDPAIAGMLNVPNAEIYAIDVSFARLKDKKEFDYLNAQPTSFVLPPEAVDRLRAAAGTIIVDSPEFKRLLRDVRARMVEEPATGQEKPQDR
ncbi:MAG: patatin-like phospholipase family protein [Thermoanaerobaculia bacterium]|jgi:NTE family protein